MDWAFLKSAIKLAKSIICKRPNYLIFFITSECNLRCKFCSNWERNATHKKEQELTLREIYLIAQNFSDLYYLTITGGEPFLRQDLVQIVSIFKRISGVEIINITSNGFSPEIIEHQVRLILKLNPTLHLSIDISIDDIEQNHDNIRGSSGSFEKAIQTITRLIKLQKNYPNLDVRTSTTISRFNEANINHTIEWIQEHLQITMPTISIVRGNPRDAEALRINKRIVLQFIKKTTEYMKSKIRTEHNPRTQLLETIKLINWEINLNKIWGKNYEYHCVAGRNMLTIDDIGEILPCEILPDSFGNLRDYDFNLQRIIQSEKCQTIMRKIKNSKCNCSFECAIQNSLVNNPRFYAYILMRYLKIKFEHIEKK